MKLHCLAAASLTALLTASCGDCTPGGSSGATSSSVAVAGAAGNTVASVGKSVKATAGISKVHAAGSPEAAFMSAIKGLRARKVSQFIAAASPSSAMDEMKAEWEAKRKEKIEVGEAQEFEQFMALLTAKGAEDALFMMAKPKLAEAQQQLGMLAAMAPMMAAGAIEESGAPMDTMALMEPMAAKLAGLDIASEEKCKKAIGILCAAARSADLSSISDLQGLDFDGVMGKADIAYGMVMDVLDVYGLSFDEALDSMDVKAISMADGKAQMEVTVTIFGKKMSPIPFEMIQGSDGRWTAPEKVREHVTTPLEPGLAR